MLILKRGQVVDVFVDDDPQVVAHVVRCDIALGECFGHGCESLTGGRGWFSRCTGLTVINQVLREWVEGEQAKMVDIIK
jgi:hypothetical protein